jgi:hypothetical protein
MGGETFSFIVPVLFSARILPSVWRLSRGNLMSSGTAKAGYTLLTSTNVAAPFSAWVTNMTGTLNASGAFSNGIPINPLEPGRFFRIRIP